MGARTPLEALVARHASASTQREMALIEDEIRETERPKMVPKRLSAVLGGPAYGYDVRSRILSAGVEEAWALVESGMAAKAVVVALQEARRAARRGGSGLAEALKEVVGRKERTCTKHYSKDGFFFRRKGGVRTREEWGDLRDSARRLIKAELRDADPAIRDKVMSDLEVDLDILVRRYRTEIRVSLRLEQGLREDAAPTREESRKIREALETLGVKRPKDMGALDVNLTRKRYRSLLREYHPDRNPGNEHAARLYIEVQESYETLIKAHERART